VTWTDELPVKDGWYWWRASDEHSPEAKHVVKGLTDWGGEMEEVRNIGGEWYGPIEVPK
jgi:hypothetical protein